MNKKYIVRLPREERESLEELVNKGKSAAYRIKHANILLAVDVDGPGWSDCTLHGERSLSMMQFALPDFYPCSAPCSVP